MKLNDWRIPTAISALLFTALLVSSCEVRYESKPAGADNKAEPPPGVRRFTDKQYGVVCYSYMYRAISCVYDQTLQPTDEAPQ